MKKKITRITERDIHRITENTIRGLMSEIQGGMDSMNGMNNMSMSTLGNINSTNLNGNQIRQNNAQIADNDSFYVMRDKQLLQSCQKAINALQWLYPQIQDNRTISQVANTSQLSQYCQNLIMMLQKNVVNNLNF